jgi:hypothetical protein
MGVWGMVAEVRQDGAPKRRRKFAAAAALGAFCLIPASEGYAVENGIYGAPTGGTDIRQAYLPDAPGIYGGAVNAFFNSPDFRGQFGDKSTTLNPAHLNAEVLGAGILIVYPWKPLGFTLGSSFQASAQYEGETLSPGVHKHGAEWGMGDSFADVIYASKYLGLFGAERGDKPWKYGLTVAAGLALELPVGTYEKSDFVNIGHDTFITIPNIAATYLTGPNLSFGGDGTEISGRLFFDTNKQNPETGYHSGNLIDLDWAVTERYGSWQIGVAGDYVQQLTSDRSASGAQVAPGGDLFAKIDLGPVIAYDFEDHSTLKFKALLPIEHENNFDNRAFVLSYTRKLVSF